MAKRTKAALVEAVLAGVASSDATAVPEPSAPEAKSGPVEESTEADSAALLGRLVEKQMSPHGPTPRDVLEALFVAEKEVHRHLSDMEVKYTDDLSRIVASTSTTLKVVEMQNRLLGQMAKEKSTMNDKNETNKTETPAPTTVAKNQNPEALGNGIVALNQRMEILNDLVRQTNQSHTALNATVTAFGRQSEDVTGAVNNLITASNNLIAATNNRLGAVEASMDSLRTRIVSDAEKRDEALAKANQWSTGAKVAAVIATVAVVATIGVGGVALYRAGERKGIAKAANAYNADAVGAINTSFGTNTTAIA